MTNFILFGLISLGSVALVGMTLGFTFSDYLIIGGAFCLAVVFYAIFMFSSDMDIMINYRSPTSNNEATE